MIRVALPARSAVCERVSLRCGMAALLIRSSSLSPSLARSSASAVVEIDRTKLNIMNFDGHHADTAAAAEWATGYLRAARLQRVLLFVFIEPDSTL